MIFGNGIAVSFGGRRQGRCACHKTCSTAFTWRRFTYKVNQKISTYMTIQLEKLICSFIWFCKQYYLESVAYSELVDGLGEEKCVRQSTRCFMNFKTLPHFIIVTHLDSEQQFVANISTEALVGSSSGTLNRLRRSPPWCQIISRALECPKLGPLPITVTVECMVTHGDRRCATIFSRGPRWGHSALAIPECVPSAPNKFLLNIFLNSFGD